MSRRDLIEAYCKWITAMRTDRDAFLSYDELDNLSVYEAAEQSADYLIKLVEEGR